MAWSSSDRAARLPGNWARLRLAVLKRDGYHCQIAGPGCTWLATEVDHIVPGDDHGLGNLQAVCTWCHARKTAGEAKRAQAKVQAKGRRPTEQHPGVIDAE
jgi:5-methylcytosine-specific restriction endonuclease McrA